MGLVPLVHAAATLAMVGIVGFVQFVHYPLFARVGAEAFPSYAEAHRRRTIRVAGAPMAVEGATAALLAARPPAGVPPTVPWLGLGLLGAVWLWTVFAVLPKHRALARGFDLRTHSALVAANGVRTVAWAARAVLALAILARVAP